MHREHKGWEFDWTCMWQQNGGCTLISVDRDSRVCFPKIKCVHMRKKKKERENLSVTLLTDFDLEDFIDSVSSLRPLSISGLPW